MCCFVASEDKLHIPSPPSDGFRVSKSLCSLTAEHSVPNRAGNNFSDINLSTGVINSSKPSIVRKKYVNFDRYPLMYAAYAACGCVSAISQKLFSSLDHLLTKSSQYSFLHQSNEQLLNASFHP